MHAVTRGIYTVIAKKSSNYLLEELYFGRVFPLVSKLLKSFTTLSWVSNTSSPPCSLLNTNGGLPVSWHLCVCFVVYTYTKPLTVCIQHAELVCTQWKSSILSFRPNTLVIVSPIREKLGVLGMVVGQHHELIQLCTYNDGRVPLSVLYIYTVAYVFHMLTFFSTMSLGDSSGVYFQSNADSNLLPYSLTRRVDLFVERCCRCIV